MDLEVNKTIERQTPKPRHRLGLSRRLGEGHGKCSQKHHVGPAECDQVQGLLEALRDRLDIASRHLSTPHVPGAKYVQHIS